MAPLADGGLGAVRLTHRRCQTHLGFTDPTGNYCPQCLVVGLGLGLALCYAMGGCGNPGPPPTLPCSLGGACPNPPAPSPPTQPTAQPAASNNPSTSCAANAYCNSPAGGGSGSNTNDNSLKDRLGNAVRGELELQGDDLHETYETGEVTVPTKIANPDPMLGPDQVRYNVDMHNPVHGTTTNYSVNYDPTTGQFGTIKPSSR
jgi:hypothetical protein